MDCGFGDDDYIVYDVVEGDDVILYGVYDDCCCD